MEGIVQCLDSSSILGILAVVCIGTMGGDGSWILGIFTRGEHGLWCLKSPRCICFSQPLQITSIFDN
jgi:hypothetical protein